MASSQALVDHDAIREWAESRKARPACVKGTGGGDDVGMREAELSATRAGTTRRTTPPPANFFPPG